jgi:6-phosphogluconate dehydrogenase (decarboxylating)
MELGMVSLGRMGVNLAERLVRGATPINYVDFGTSGGIWGLTEGHSMKRSGHAQPVRRSRNQERVSPRP